MSLLAAGAALAVLGAVGVQAVGGIPSWGGLFEQQVVDRSPAPLITAIQDVAQFRAATGTFQVLVDLERDTPNIPSVISGERTTLFAAGTVDALVEFSAVDADRVAVSTDGRSVTIRLPAPVLGAAVLDPARSRVVGRERGLVERVGGLFDDSPVDDQELYVLAAARLDDSARSSGLVERAEVNTRTMLAGLVEALGFDQVTVMFDTAGPQ